MKMRHLRDALDHVPYARARNHLLASRLTDVISKACLVQNRILFNIGQTIALNIEETCIKNKKEQNKL